MSLFFRLINIVNILSIKALIIFKIYIDYFITTITKTTIVITKYKLSKFKFISYSIRN